MPVRPLVTLHVALDGDDSWSGALPSPNAASTDGPLASLHAARDAVRELRRAGHAGDIHVLLRGGVHVLRETAVFGLEDGAPSGSRTIYAAYPDETPILSAGVPLQGWRRLLDPLPGLPAAAMGNIWFAETEPDRNVLTLYAGRRRLPRARSAGFRPLDAHGYEWWGPDHRMVRFPPGAMHSGPGVRNAELSVRPGASWVMNLLPLDSVDEESGVARTSAEATYQMGRVELFHADVPTAWVENVAEGMTEPGRWMVDPGQGLIYLYAPDGPPVDVAVPVLRELIRVEGQAGGDLDEDLPVRGLTFRDLTFACTERLAWPMMRGNGLLHDWDFHDSATSALRFRGAEACVVHGCRFEGLGGGAVRLDLHCIGNRIIENHISDIGGTAILLCGYGPGTKDVNRCNEVLDNHIERCGQVFWHAAAVHLWQSGENRIAHNHIHHVPYGAVAVTGVRRVDRELEFLESRLTVRWGEIESVCGPRTRLAWAELIPFLHSRGNVIESNEIHDAVENLADGNAVYVSGAGEGNLIRRNYIHDVSASGTAGAIRTDDLQQGTLVRDNVIYRCAFAGIYVKQRNHVENNLVYDLRAEDATGAPLPHGVCGFVALCNGETTIAGGRFQRNVLVATTQGLPLYATLLPGDAARDIDQLSLEDNLYWCELDPSWAEEHLARRRERGQELRSIEEDPRLVLDESSRRFSFAAGSPAPALGIEPFDVTLAGPRPGTMQARCHTLTTG